MKIQLTLTALAAITAVMTLISPTTEAATTAKQGEGPRPLAIEMGTPFHDHAILQRGMKVPVWGWSKPGTTITVAFADQTKSGQADATGKWMVELDPLKANAEPRVMVITEATGKQEVLNDILVGEVWMCSGQSNMELLAKKCNVGRTLIPEIEARVEAGEEQRPIIREAKVTNVFSSLYPTEHAKGQWSLDWEYFSAISFAFAYDIARELQVPVGLLNCSFSTTKIQAWVPREGFAAGEDAYTKAIYRKILESDYRTPEHKAAWAQYEQDLKAWAADSAERTRKGLSAAPRPTVPGNMNGNRDATWMCNGKMMPMTPYAIRGAIWNQGYASQNEGVVYRNNLHSLVRGLRAVFRNPDLPVYFHQFYTGKVSDTLRFGGAAGMRLGTWLAHDDIPNAAMASQIDITGGVHYYNKAIPGQRLARHALKNQYPSTELSTGGKAGDIIANGPMYKGYKVKGDKLILSLEHADGLQVGRSRTEYAGYGGPDAIKNGDEQVTLFYLADKEFVWHRARPKIKGKQIVLTAPGLEDPRGVAYAWQGVGFRPSIYNKGMLPLTPFIVYDHKLVVSDRWDLDAIRIPGVKDRFEFFTWPMPYLKTAGEAVDPTSYGLQAKYRKLWLLSPQFTHNCVIQEGVPTRLYGKAIPGSVVTVKFAGFEGSLALSDAQDEWEITVPAMEASAEPKLLHVTCTLDGELAHERKISNVVIGDVWYVAAPDFKVRRGAGVPGNGPAPREAWKGGNAQLRMLTSGGKRAETMPMRFKMNASGNPSSRFFTKWAPTTGLTKYLAEKIHARTGKPVGIIVLDRGGGSIKDWTGYEYLTKIPAWKDDVEKLRSRYAADPESFARNADAYLQGWKTYWQGIEHDPDFNPAAMPAFPGRAVVKTKATTVYNQSICAFSPGNFKAILCITGKGFVGEDEGAGFGPQFSVMANCWKETFARGKEVIDPHFVYVMPGKGLAPNITSPAGIRGTSTPYSSDTWLTIGKNWKTRQDIVGDELGALLDAAVKAVYQ